VICCYVFRKGPSSLLLNTCSLKESEKQQVNTLLSLIVKYCKDKIIMKFFSILRQSLGAFLLESGQLDGGGGPSISQNQGTHLLIVLGIMQMLTRDEKFGF